MNDTPKNNAFGSEFDELCAALAAEADALDISGQWPAESLRRLGDAGVYAWFVPKSLGGAGWSDIDLTRGYLRLSAACMLTTFVLTQRVAACRRIVESENTSLAEKLAPRLLASDCFVTVGISHLTTSRRHLATPPMAATESDDGFVLNGYTPWVTGGTRAEGIVTGAVLEDGRQILVYVPTSLAGVAPQTPARLVGLSGSETGEVKFDNVRVPREMLLAGPVENVMARGAGGAGGLQTSTLAVGLANAAIEYLESQAAMRGELLEPAAGLRSEHSEVEALLLHAAAGRPDCSTEELRTRANSLVLRSTQAALTAAKGAGYVIGHPAGRWCREALFFLVWSCPQGVATANLCELAGIAD